MPNIASMRRLRAPLGWLRRGRAAPPAIRPPYARANGLQRHRGKLALLLFMVTLIYILAFQLFGRFIIVQFVMPLFAMALLIIWALPELGRAPTNIMTFLFFSFATAFMVWPDYLALALPGLPWITAIRLTGLPLAIIFLISLSISKGFRSEIKEIIGQTRSLHPVLISLILLMTFSVLLSANIAFSFNKLFVVFISLIIPFYVSAFVFSQRGNPSKFIAIVWIIVLVLCAIGLWEARISRVPWATSIPSFLAIEDESVKRILAGGARAATGIYRVQTKFTTSLSFAEFLVLSSPFFLHLGMTARRIWIRPAALVTLPLVFWLIIKTDSRLGASGFLMTFVLYLAAWSILRWHRDRRSLFGPALTLAYPVIFACFIAATFYIGRLRAMVWGTGAHQFSNAAREVQWETAIPKVISRPWGHGIGQGAEALGYTNLEGTLTIDSYYLSVLLELGLIGFCLYFAIPIIIALQSAIKMFETDDDEERLLVPIIISLANFVIIKSVLSQQEGHPFVFILMGMAVALIFRIKRRRATASL